ncbi:unnamed protein product [Musa acuminata subsp. burmannicoides]
MHMEKRIYGTWLVPQVSCLLFPLFIFGICIMIPFIFFVYVSLSSKSSYSRLYIASKKKQITIKENQMYPSRGIVMIASVIMLEPLVTKFKQRFRLDDFIIVIRS